MTVSLYELRWSAYDNVIKIVGEGEHTAAKVDWFAQAIGFADWKQLVRECREHETKMRKLLEKLAGPHGYVFFMIMKAQK